MTYANQASPAVLLKNGDYISRQVLGMTTSPTPPHPNIMALVTPLDRVVKTTDIELFGRLILCRFDQDELELKHDTPHRSECDLSFRELPKEYAGL